jgi:hypothetical protein
VTRLPVLLVAGVPRSGTTWVGQVLNSHPAVAYRFQPLFSWSFQPTLDAAGTPEEIEAFFDAVLATDDPFVRQTGAARLGDTPDFPERDAEPALLVVKEVDHLDLVPHLLASRADLSAVLLVRDPRAVLASFRGARGEWDEAWDFAAEWRQARSKNEGRVDRWYGFERWKEAALLFLDLVERHPQRVMLARYEDLVGEPAAGAERLLAFAGLPSHPQVARFVGESTTAADRQHDYGVFKDRSVVWRWREELDPGIAAEIAGELRGTPLERFLAGEQPR